MKLLLQIACAFALSSPAMAEANGFPRVEYRYGSVFDSQCALTTSTTIAPEWLEELRVKMPAWQTQWNEQGTAVLQKTIDLTGRGFQQRDMIAAIFLCRRWTSMSIPLLVKGAWFLEGPSNGQPKSTDLLVGLTYHELLHTFVVENLEGRWPTPLIQEYSAESPRTKNHLHVYAIMTAAKVFRKLSRHQWRLSSRHADH